MSTKQSNRTVVETQSRKQHKQSKKPASTGGKSKIKVAQTREHEKTKRKEARRKKRKPRRRIFPIWLRIILVLISCAAALIIGSMVGYGILGDGSPSDALKVETWQHIIDIVTKQE